jgi:predicted dehydrogenase
MITRTCSRRDFLATTGAAAATFACFSELPAAQSNSPNEKLNIGVIGVGGRARANINGVRSENIVALCDIDENRLAQAKEDFPKAQTFVDWRKLLDEKSIDAIVLSTPDHTHAVAGVAAMKSGRHLYCEKPLAHSIQEGRVMARTAEETGVATQLGNQNHATDRLRKVVELLRAGGLGGLKEVVCWSSKSDSRFSPGDRPTETAPVPDHVHWDLWLGPAPERPYHPTAYHPFNWRGWWDFGEGNFGDMACHIMDTPFWGLDLDYPETVEVEGPPVHPESAPPWLIARYRFPARNGRPPVKLTWYDGSKSPPRHLFEGIELPSQGCMIVAEKGNLLFPHSRGETQLFVGTEPVSLEFPEPTLPRPESHYAEWIEACKTGSPTFSNFEYGAKLSEVALVGIVAYRTGTKKLEWDGPAMQARNSPDAEPLIRPEFRQGWTI